MKNLLSLLSVFCALCSVLSNAHASAGEFDLDRWYGVLNQIQDRAVAENISGSVINDVIQDAVFIPGTIKSDKNQAEFKLTLDEYVARMISSTRIKNGRAMGAKYPTLLRRVDEKYGVPKNVILAFWGLESNYGEFKARYKLSDAFLSLIYDGRRDKFFGDQLIALMKIADKNNLGIAGLRGSWAGAMGHFQFIPTTLAQYGVDGNNDGRVDIIHNISDAMFSAGNYLNKLGWDKHEKILRPAAIPAGFDMSLCDAKTKKSLDDWAAAGITNPDGTPLPTADKKAGIVCDEKSSPQSAYLVYDNFYRIKKWNNSNYYAVAVGLLSEELK